MFFDTDYTTEAIKAAETHLGPMGRYTLLADERFGSVSLYTADAGIFWHGDISWPLERSALNKIARELREPVFVIPAWEAGMYADGRPYSDGALAKVGQ